MVYPHDVQNGGVYVMGGHLFIDSLVPVFVGSAVLYASLDAAPGQPSSEGVGVVIPAFRAL